MSASAIPSSTSPSFTTTVPKPKPASAPLATAPSLLSEPVTLSQEARQRLTAETAERQRDPGAAAGVPTSQADLRSLLKRGPEATGVDLSRNPPPLSFNPENWIDFADLLSAPELTGEQRGQLTAALQQATGHCEQVSYDPAVDLAVRKMKLDYIRDNVVPASMRPRADAAISSYVAHTAADTDRIFERLDRLRLESERHYGRADLIKIAQDEVNGYASGNARGQRSRAAMLDATAGKHYGTPADAGTSFSSSVAAIKKVLLDQVATWPRAQGIGVAAADAEMRHIRENWSAFVAQVGSPQAGYAQP